MAARMAAPNFDLVAIAAPPETIDHQRALLFAPTEKLNKGINRSCIRQ
jgi:hypothetical protein